MPRIGPVREVQTSKVRFTPPAIRRAGKNLYRLEGDFVVYWKQYKITVFDGFVCDLASIPRIAWLFISKLDLGFGPAIDHDCLYPQGDMNNGQDGKIEIASTGEEVDSLSKEQSDELFADMLEAIEVAKWRIDFGHWGVDTFGDKAWEGE